jgi:hypothetical protein
MLFGDIIYLWKKMDCMEEDGLPHAEIDWEAQYISVPIAFSILAGL